MESSELRDSWPKLLAAARAGDADAAGQLLQQAAEDLNSAAHKPRLDAQLQSKLSPSDLVQQSLLEIAGGLSSFRGASEQEFRDWTRRILQHNVIDAQRMFIGAECRDVRRETALTAADGLCAPAKSPSSVARRSERDQQLESAIAALPENFRTVIHLRHQQGRAWPEIGHQLGVSAEAARKLWARAVKRLQDILISKESRVA